MAYIPGVAGFVAGLRTYWEDSLTAIVGFSAKNYGTCSRLSHEEVELLTNRYSRFHERNMRGTARRSSSESQLTSPIQAALEYALLRLRIRSREMSNSGLIHGKSSVTAIRGLLVAAILAAGSFSFAQSAPPDSGSLETQLTNRELALANAERTHDKAAFNRLLDDRLIYVAYNGWVFTKKDMLSKMHYIKDMLSKMHYIDVNKYDPHNFKVRLPGNSTALITYDLKAKASIAGRDVPNSQYVSSLWVRKGGQWKLLFHQATPATHS